MKPRTLCPCHPVAFMISSRVAPLGRSSSALIFAVLLPVRAVGAFWWPLGAGLPRLALLCADLAGTGAPWGLCAATLGFLAGSPRLWIAAQTRLIAVLRSTNFLIGVTPGRLFQISPSRPALQLAASFPNSSLLLNLSEPSVFGTCWPAPKAVMLFSLSITNVFILVLTGRIDFVGPHPT